MATPYLHQCRGNELTLLGNPPRKRGISVKSLAHASGYDWFNRVEASSEEFGEESQEVINARDGLAGIYRESDDLDSWEETVRENLKLKRRVLGDEHEDSRSSVTAAFARRWPNGTRATAPSSLGASVAAILARSSTVAGAGLAATIGYSTAYYSGVVTLSNSDNLAVSLAA